MANTFVALVGFAVFSTAAGCGPANDGPGPKPEVLAKTTKVELPAVPTLDIPEPDGDIHSVRELQLVGAKYFTPPQEISLRGYVTWDYDCIRDGGKSGPWDEEWSDSKIKAEIAKDNTLCRKPHFYVGDTPDATDDAVVWVADLPEKDQPPAEGMPTLTKYAVGDKVLVKGVFDRSSITGFRHAKGLLQYKSLEVLEPAPKKAP